MNSDALDGRGWSRIGKTSQHGLGILEGNDNGYSQPSNDIKSSLHHGSPESARKARERELERGPNNFYKLKPETMSDYVTQSFNTAGVLNVLIKQKEVVVRERQLT